MDSGGVSRHESRDDSRRAFLRKKRPVVFDAAITNAIKSITTVGRVRLSRCVEGRVVLDFVNPQSIAEAETDRAVALRFVAEIQPPRRGALVQYAFAGPTGDLVVSKSVSICSRTC